MPHATHPSPGLQAFILCGPGVSLNTFTSNPDDFPKALVPIANRPMVWYAIDWCHNIGIIDITLITPPESANALEAALNTNPALTALPSPRAAVLAPEELSLTTGTAEILRISSVQKAITSDFIILPCDLISELQGSKLLQQWMSLNPFTVSHAASTSSQKGGLALYYPVGGLEGISSKRDETDFLATSPLPASIVPPVNDGIRSHIEQILLNMPTDTLKDVLEADADKGLKLRRALLQHHGRVTVKTKHRDAHVYILPKWVKDYAAANETFDSIPEDLVAWWAKAGWQQGLAAKLSLDTITKSSKAPLQMDESQTLVSQDIDIYALSSTMVQRSGAQDPTSFASRVSNSGSEGAPSTWPPPIYAYVQPSLPPVTADPSKPAVVPSSLTQPLIRRIDTSAALLNVSLYLAKQNQPHIYSHEHKIHPTAQIGVQSRISSEDSLIGENVNIGMRANVKESVIGAGCEIGANARLTRCLLMEGVIVGEGVQMTGCIIGKRAKIEGVKVLDSQADVAPAGESQGKTQGKKKKLDDDDNKTRLTDCEIAPGFVVEGGTQSKGEKMMAFDADAEIDDLTAEEAADEI